MRFHCSIYVAGTARAAHPGRRELLCCRAPGHPSSICRGLGVPNTVLVASFFPQGHPSEPAVCCELSSWGSRNLLSVLKACSQPFPLLKLEYFSFRDVLGPEGSSHLGGVWGTALALSLVVLQKCAGV